MRWLSWVYALAITAALRVWLGPMDIATFLFSLVIYSWCFRNPWFLGGLWRVYRP